MATNSEREIGPYWWPSKLLHGLDNWSGLLHHVTVAWISCKGKHTNVPFLFLRQHKQWPQAATQQNHVSMIFAERSVLDGRDQFWMVEIKDFL